MFEHFFFKHIIFYFILIMYLNTVGHTVDSSSDPVSSHQSELLFKNKTDHVKRGEKDQDSTKTKNQSVNIINLSEEKLVPPAKNFNVSKVVPVEDVFNSTAHLPPWMMIRDGALQRTGYVVLGFMSIVVFFFVVRAVRLRHKKSKSRKYGIITSTVSDMEMEPLDKDDDEEEDATIFDAQHKYSLQ